MITVSVESVYLTYPIEGAEDQEFDMSIYLYSTFKYNIHVCRERERERERGGREGRRDGGRETDKERKELDIKGGNSSTEM